MAGLRTKLVLDQIEREREHQEEKFPDQRLSMGGGPLLPAMLHDMRLANDNGRATWSTVLLEELYEALLETDPVKQRKEWVQVAAVAVRVVENIDAEAVLP